MYYEDLNPEVQSDFIKSNITVANLTSESQLPLFGLFARNLLTDTQMDKVKKIRSKRFKTESQKNKFKED
ncbi:MAG: hypothetical protein SFU98_08245 [Leptospiraceae bacterium]|nr:hypothetical protein [Leptospiraceae bacterium]